MEKARTRRLWTFLAAMAAIMWGISGLFAKGLFNISSKITPMWLTQIRLIVSGIVLLILAAICAFIGVFLLSTHGQFNHLAITPVALFGDFFQLWKKPLIH